MCTIVIPRKLTVTKEIENIRERKKGTSSTSMHRGSQTNGIKGQGREESQFDQH